MSLLVVGSVAFDNVETPFGKAERALGGSALYFSTSASYFTDVSLVAVVGEDFPEEATEFLHSRGVDTRGLQRTKGETFCWKGKYGFDLNEAVTLDTQLNVFGDFHPELPADYCKSTHVFLANIDPELQLEVLKQIENPEFVALDTMNFWIESKRDALIEIISKVDMVLINETEARQLADDPNIVKAAQTVLAMGPKYVVIKRGEYGALLFCEDDEPFFAPAYPLEAVFDPTGAGDTFAGGLLGFLSNNAEVTPEKLRQAMVLGGVMASFCVQEFSFNNLRDLSDDKIAKRFERFEKLVRFNCLES
ncbi:PfkB family carbohydrate kinase [Bradymonas sediminis]|uniref:Sugar kinase n=1 Tax=Bradymonas sediminis TaxID=1548548 RepID=A0A2Z4FJP6_9DELT|nr:PfkB family carbohydrate kinase [Bradymonas sediminis]AWV89173.1 sugar kinase [Bradymonas sediminis]TDP64360.1 sugar/nucleoside kinase (ribokinase family) [Bradymonas sediminis]